MTNAINPLNLICHKVERLFFSAYSAKNIDCKSLIDQLCISDQPDDVPVITPSSW